MTYSDVVRMKEFGVVTRNPCQFELELLKSNDPNKLPIDANAMFELYIEDENGNLIDVPVLISNFREPGDSSFEEDKLPNKERNSSSNRLVRRFFIYDTISGIDDAGGYESLANPSIVRYA